MTVECENGPEGKHLWMADRESHNWKCLFCKARTKGTELKKDDKFTTEQWWKG